eukprot:3558847-Rhodomonas_salina.1
MLCDVRYLHTLGDVPSAISLRACSAIPGTHHTQSEYHTPRSTIPYISTAHPVAPYPISVPHTP